jgi:hypothetical protein
MQARKHGDDRELAGFPALGELIRRMEAAGAAVRERRDPRRFFHATYLRTIRAPARSYPT